MVDTTLAGIPGVRREQYVVFELPENYYARLRIAEILYYGADHVDDIDDAEDTPYHGN